jgi:hypothetical protein
MKKIYLIGLIFILVPVTSALIGCASSEYIPKGSTKIGTLEGSFSGTRFMGSCRIDIFELQDGTRRFEGSFRREDMDAAVFLRGTLAGNQLDGQLQAPADGSISGSLSADGSQIKGNYSMTSPSTDNGTWKAMKK